MSGSALLASMRAACEGFGRVGVAVSGGSDSVAALILAVEALGPGRVAAVTVDHGLRPEAAEEAAAVAALCARLGVAHDMRRWEGAGAIKGNLQNAARRARLDLIAEWAIGAGLGAVVLGHTLDDQAETVLMRLARGSGVDGLSAMAARREALGVVWLRPLLGARRAELRDLLRARGIGWAEDPSNEAERFDRVRARRALEVLAPLGIEAEGLAALAERMALARAALEAQAGAAMAAHLREDRGVVHLDAGLFAQPQEIVERIIATVLMGLSGAEYRPRLADLRRLISARAGTLMGCMAVSRDDGGLLIAREAQAVAELRSPADALWDGRWRAEPPVGASPDGADIAALGAAGLAQLSQQARAGSHPHWRDTGLPESALRGLPGVWRGARLVAAPMALWPNGWALSARPLVAPRKSAGELH